MRLTMNVVDELMSHPAVVLQDVEILCARSSRNLLRHWKQLLKTVVRDVGKLGTMIFWNDQLFVSSAPSV